MDIGLRSHALVALCLLLPALIACENRTIVTRAPDVRQARTTLAPVLERVAPAVVNIAVESRVAIEQNPLFQEPFFRFFFGDIPQEPQERRLISAGSGVIVDAERGYVLTNNHVVANATKITVTSANGRSFTARRIGGDEATDLAVLQIPGGSLTELRLGDSDALRVGDFVVAIGNPFGLGQTVTSGIVSALGRSGLTPEGYEDFIQTDAPINPGNSGGPLITWDGELVGINTAIIAPGGGSIGIGFAVPSRMAQSVLDQLVRFGELRRGRIGIVIRDRPADGASVAGVAAASGAVIVRVAEGSAAERVGLKIGDVILELDGEPVRSAVDFRNKVGLIRVGSEIRLALDRGGKVITKTVRIVEA